MEKYEDLIKDRGFQFRPGTRFGSYSSLTEITSGDWDFVYLVVIHWIGVETSMILAILIVDKNYK